MGDSNANTFLNSIFDSKDSTWKPSDKIPLINKEIELQKAGLKSFLQNNDADISTILTESEELCQESKSLIDDMLECKQEIEEATMAEIINSIEYHGQLSKELEQVQFTLQLISDVLQSGRYIKEYHEGRKHNSFSKSTVAINKLFEFLDNPSEGFRCMEIYANVRHKASELLDSMLQELYTIWDSMISLTTNVGTRKTILTLKLNTDKDNVVDILNSLEKSKKLHDKISELAQFIMKDVIDPIIHNECRIILDGDDVLSVHIVHKANNKPKYKDVLDNLNSLFLYLSKRLCLEITPERTLVQMVGDEISTEFRETLVRDCLMETVPNNINDLSNYNTITSEIRDFQQHLADMNVYPLGSFVVLGYVDEMEGIFAKKASQHFLETARSIMLKDLSDTMSIGVESIPEESKVKANNTLDETTENALKILDKTIPKSLFYFPRCMISKSAQELLDLVNDMMEQTVQCSEMLQKRFYCTTRMVFELYDAVVPYHHEQYLQTIPQYVALFHNNCMYLAHNLQLLGDRWRHLLAAEGQAIGFMDLVQPLRDLGYKHLAAHLQYQRKQILDNIRSSELNSMAAADSLGAGAEAALRQCLRQLALLKTVWSGVLPANVFTSLMATLTHMFVSEMIHRVVSVEDISAEMATQLSTIYSVVVQKAPALFQHPSDLESRVKSWPKLLELIFVLGGTLKELEARWGDGSGPLAQHFTADELRNLIKALFQNTQLRANLLSKIK